jgi:hypothetical protein
MKRYQHYSFLVFLLLTANQLMADEAHPLSFQATYKLFSGGLEIAQMERTMSKSAGDEYIYRSKTQTIGLVAVFHKDLIEEESRWKLVDGEVFPVNYSYNRSKGKKNRKVNIFFDWDNNVMINEIRDQRLNMPLESGVLDKLLYQYALMRDVKNNNFPITYNIADGGKMKTYHFERLGDETIQTPLGNFNTVKIQSNESKDDKKLVIWCAPELKYLPIKVEHTEEDGRVTTAVIQTLTEI